MTLFAPVVGNFDVRSVAECLNEGRTMGITLDWRQQPVAALQLSVRAQRCVESTSVTTIGELCELSEEEFLASRGFGETALRETRARLAELGLRFRDTPTKG